MACQRTDAAACLEFRLQMRTKRMSTKADLHMQPQARHSAYSLRNTTMAKSKPSAKSPVVASAKKGKKQQQAAVKAETKKVIVAACAPHRTSLTSVG